MVVCMGIGFGQGRHGEGLAPLVGMVAGVALSWSLLMGPHILRQDFRQDLLLADVLKTFPIPPWQLALGEILGPVIILTAVDWLLIVLAAILLSQTRNLGMDRALVGSIALGVALILPMLNLVLFLVPNAAALLFPGWFLSSRTVGGGVEVIGQRLVFFFGQVLALLASLLPGAGVFTLVFFLGQKLVPVPVVIPIAALGTAAVLAVEAGFGVVLLGHLFSRFDLTTESNP